MITLTNSNEKIIIKKLKKIKNKPHSINNLYKKIIKKKNARLSFYNHYKSQIAKRLIIQATSRNNRVSSKSNK